MEIKKVNYKTFDVFVGKGWKFWVRIEAIKDKLDVNKIHARIVNFNSESLNEFDAKKVMISFLNLKFSGKNHVFN